MNSTCPPELILAMHADRELIADDAVATELHLSGCARCRTQLAALRSEASIVAAALAYGTASVIVPTYKRPVSRIAMVATAAGGMLVAVLLAVLPSLLGGLLEGSLTWVKPFDFNPFDFNPFNKGTLADLGIDAAIYLAKHGGAIMTSIAKTALIAVLTTLVGWLALARRGRVRGPLLIAGLFGVLLLPPTPSQALEIRHAEHSVYIPAGETIDDTLIVFGESVEIDGVVTGDVIAVGRRIAIRGHVGGDAVTAAQSVTIDGEVDGNVLSIATELGVGSSRIGRNLYGLGSTINLNPRANVAKNAVVAGERVQLAGAVGGDVLGAAENFEVSGSVGRALTAYAEHLALLPTARIAGDVTANVPHANGLIVAAGAVIGGKLKTQLMQQVERNQYLTPGFYGAQLLRFAAAFLTGAILLALVPGLCSLALNGVADALLSGGVGLVALVATPIIAVLAAITIIGMPIGVLGLFLWMAGIYLAKIVVAHFVGARLIETSGRQRHFAIALALGLLLVIVVINLPLVGGLFNFVLTILGLGVLVLFVRRAYRGD